MRVDFSIKLSSKTVEILRRLSKKTGLAQWQLVTMSIQLLEQRFSKSFRGLAE